MLIKVCWKGFMNSIACHYMELLIKAVSRCENQLTLEEIKKIWCIKFWQLLDIERVLYLIILG
jgi:hypothetical protein